MKFDASDAAHQADRRRSGSFPGKASPPKWNGNTIASWGARSRIILLALVPGIFVDRLAGLPFENLLYRALFGPVEERWKSSLDLKNEPISQSTEVFRPEYLGVVDRIRGDVP